MCEHEHPVNTLHQQMIFPDENAPIHRKKSVVTAAASGRSIGTVLAEKKKPGGGGARKALNDITNKSSGVLHPKASSNNKQIASGSGKCETNNIGGEMFLHDHTKCIKEQQGLWDDHFSADLLLLHHDSSSVKDKHLKYETAMMNASKNNLTCDEPEEIQSPKLTSYMKRSTPWRSPVRHGSVMKKDAFHSSGLAV